MQGELIGVWSETWREIWLPLVDEPLGEGGEGVPEDVFCELYRALDPALSPRNSVEDLADIIDDPVQSRAAFEGITETDLADERALAGFFEAAHDALDELGGDGLTNRYFNLLSRFIEKYNLRYDLRRPCTLCPTLPGVFASLVRDLRALTNQDPHLDSLMKDFEEAVRDLRYDASDRRIRTCIQKQFNLLEAMGSAFPGVTGNTLGTICDQVGTWPHEKLKLAMKNLYRFGCDYPGIRHGGTPASALRPMEMRDMVAVSILLTGFTPYMESGLSADAIFGGSAASVGPIPPSAVQFSDPTFVADTTSEPRGLLNRLAFWRRGR